ncbi:MAG: 3-deoxy-D-manno-octulosonic acid transferase [Alphaproteobacteria bacterium]|nr:3-deoxy-D-manno-octulosonic acid transferase [Alphaproteobacteria bacterium]
MLLAIYKAVMRASTPFLEAYLQKRAARGKEDVERAAERRGHADRARPAAPLVWCHAASVGEALSLLSVVERLLRDNPAVSVMVTTGTVTSARLMEERLPKGAFHQFVPVDHPRWVARFLDHWRPDLVIWSESEFWPNMLSAIRARGIPAVLLNARMSEKTFARWQWARGTMASLLSAFDLCLGQNAAEAARLEKLGARNVRVSANLKYAAAPLPCDGEKLATLEQSVKGRSLLLWASTHEGEEEIAADVHKALARDVKGLLTIIVPRHPARGEDIFEMIEKRELRPALRSSGDMPDEELPPDIYIADTLGELGLFYRLCKTVVIGGSFAQIGGHNPIEPAQLGCAIFYGPQMYNFISINQEFLDAKAAVQVHDVAALQAALKDALADPAAVAPLRDAALKLTAEKSGIVDALAALLNPYVEKAAAHYARGGKAAA